MKQRLSAPDLYRQVRSFPRLADFQFDAAMLSARIPANPSTRAVFFDATPPVPAEHDLIAAAIFADILEVMTIADRVASLAGRQVFMSLLWMRLDDWYGAVVGSTFVIDAFLSHLALVDERFR